MKPSDIKLKIQKIKNKEQELLLKEQAIAEFKPLFDKMKSSIKEKTVNNNILVIKEMFSSLNENMDSSDVIEAINKLSDKTDNEKMLLAMNKMVTNLSKLEKKNYFDVEEFNKIFVNGLSKVINAVVDPNEIPSSTIYKRNQKDKIISVTENYEDQTIKYNWIYNSRGKLIRVNAKTT